MNEETRAPLILCCEDEPSLRRDIAEELREAGYRVCEAADGSEAVAAMATLRPDLILCDIMMPGLDGYGVLARFRREFPHLAHVPLVFLSALSMPEAVVRGKRAGADDYLIKPIDYDLLLSTIEARLRQSTRARQQTAPVARIGRHMLDHLSVGVLAYDSAGSLIHANSTAEELLPQGTKAEATLAEPVRGLLLAAQEGREEVQSVMLNCEGQKTCLALLFSCPAAPGYAEEAPAVLVYLTDPSRRRPLAATALKEMFGLTPTEARVARHLAVGLRPDEVSSELDVSPTTTAFHMRNIFGKTGTHRQADLVALMLSLPVQARS
ncbi:response regulator [Alkalilacustris brevis]|uniref:response regulator n=1 Tax=Alkalilacustris brevis TaxID=2026338 RepID=UPI000E0D90D8|nr:response regulator [Alkalilacustris brevis]